MISKYDVTMSLGDVVTSAAQGLWKPTKVYLKGILSVELFLY